MLGRAPRKKETLPNFCENMDPDKWDTIVWYRVTRNPQEFSGLTGCQRDPRFGVSQLGIRALVNDYLGSSNVGIHKYGLDARSSQLCIKSLGT